MDLEIYAYRRYAAVAKYNGTDGIVVIPQTYTGVPVTEIKNAAFAGNSHVREVIIPKTMEVIGDGAFEKCTNLSYIFYSESNGTVCGKDATGKPIRSTFPPGLHTIGFRAFSESGLKSVTILSKLIELGDFAFAGCPALVFANFPECDKIILGKQVFMGSSISEFCAPKAIVDTLPEGTFADCVKLQRVAVRINAVGARAFYNCGNLEAVNMPPRLRTVVAGAFTGCSKLEYAKRYNPPSKPPKLIEAPKDLPQGSDAKLPKPLEIQMAQRKLIEELCVIMKQREKWLTGGSPSQRFYGGSTVRPKKMFFQLGADYANRNPATHLQTVNGFFVEDSGEYWFVPSNYRRYEKICLNETPVAERNWVVPLIKYLGIDRKRVDLIGEQNETVFMVFDIQIENTATNNEACLSVGFYSEVIRRIKRLTPTDRNPNGRHSQYTIRRPIEYEAFLEICGNLLPEWVIAAYHRNKELAHTASGSDDIKHAERAQNLLLNIDWLPNVLNIPTAAHTKAELDAAFYGLDEVKTNIMEAISQIRRIGMFPKWGILLHGPAGTGKTSIAKAIAKVLKLPIIQMDIPTLGDSPDTISGSSRIYYNGRPGMLLESMYTIHSSTALLLANEVDKAAGAESNVGDTLLTILDKTGFYENYLEEIIPTDNLFCIGTCNNLEKISKPLLDRFHVIEIPGYTPAEKKAIFTNFVFPKAMRRSNIASDQIEVSEGALELLISQYAVEPGARDLEQYAERLIGDFCLYSDGKSDSKRIYTADDIKRLLGIGKIVSKSFALCPGMATTAYYYQGQAQMYHIEAATLPGTGKLEIIGVVGSTQREYCKAAYYCVRNTIPYDLSKTDVTLFVSEAIPDNAQNNIGLACYAAICSKLLNKKLPINTCCFIGGCNLNGSVYFDGNTITPLLRSMMSSGITVLYGPVGISQLMGANETAALSTTIVEGPDAQFLFRLALAGNSFDQ